MYVCASARASKPTTDSAHRDYREKCIEFLAMYFFVYALFGVCHAKDSSTIGFLINYEVNKRFRCVSIPVNMDVVGRYPPRFYMQILQERMKFNGIGFSSFTVETLKIFEIYTGYFSLILDFNVSHMHIGSNHLCDRVEMRLILRNSTKILSYAIFFFSFVWFSLFPAIFLYFALSSSGF